MRNFARIFFTPFFKRPKNRLLWQKSGKFIAVFGRNGPKRAFLAKNGQNVTNLKFYGCPTSCKKTEKNYSAVLAAEPERTDGRTNGRG